MYEVLILPFASRMLRAIVTELILEDDDEAFEDLDLATLLLETIPLRVGDSRASSVHRLVARGRIMIEYEVIEDDKRVLVHGFSLLPARD